VVHEIELVYIRRDKCNLVSTWESLSLYFSILYIERDWEKRTGREPRDIQKEMQR